MHTDLQNGFWEKLGQEVIEIWIGILQFLSRVTPVMLAVGMVHLGITSFHQLRQRLKRFFGEAALYLHV